MHAMQQECIIVLKAAAFVSSEGVYFREALVSGEQCTYKLYQNVLQTLLRVRVAPLLKATGESGESGFLKVCALGPGAQSSRPSSSLARDPIVFKVTLSTQESKWVRANCWENLTNCGEVTSVPSRGEEILLAASCYRNRDMLWTL